MILCLGRRKGCCIGDTVVWESNGGSSHASILARLTEWGGHDGFQNPSTCSVYFLGLYRLE